LGFSPLTICRAAAIIKRRSDIATQYRNCERLILINPSQIVIPGLPEGRNPESMNTGLWNMASGSAAPPRPGMTC
jgi:hypothetical protein